LFLLRLEVQKLACKNARRSIICMYCVLVHLQITAHTPFRLIHLPPFVESTFITVITLR